MRRVDRRWLELHVRCPAVGEAAGLLADGLVALGGRAVEERDGWYVTHLPDPGDLSAFEHRAAAALAEATGLSGVEMRTSWRAQEDWAETWKRGLGLRRVTDRIVVRPSWIEHTPSSPDELVIVLDPGMAFGTAEHGTTRGCLRLLDRLVRPGDDVLDVGSGSGVLSIAAARLGASRVTAIEGDPLACEALHENLAINDVARAVRVLERWADADLLAGLGAAAGVVANIDTGILSPLFPALVSAVRPGGWLVVSGITANEWPSVRTAITELGAEPGPVDADDGWISGVFRPRDPPEAPKLRARRAR